MRRPHIGQGLRQDLFRACGEACAYCDVPLRLGDRWHTDHVEPFVVGGPTTPQNLVASCGACNNVASSTTYPTFWVKRVEVRRLRGLYSGPSRAEILPRVQHLSPHLLKGPAPRPLGIFLPPRIGYPYHFDIERSSPRRVAWMRGHYPEEFSVSRKAS